MKWLRGLLYRLRPPGFEAVEQAERAFYRRYLGDGMIVFDVGANVGELTLLFSRLAAGGAVHAFEPAPDAFEALRSAVERERAANVTLNAAALADRPGSVRLNCYDGPFHAFTSMADRPLADYGVDAGPARPVDVEATTLDAYCEAKGVDRIDLLKIDVEGAELQVLRGARAMLAAKRIGCVAFEFGQTTFDMGNRPEDIAGLLREQGYRLSNLVEGAPLFPGGRSAKTARFAMHLAMPR